MREPKVVVYEDKGFGSSDKIEDAAEDSIDAGDRPDVKKYGGCIYFFFFMRAHHDARLYNLLPRNQHKELEGKSEYSTKSCSIGIEREGMQISDAD